jgi:alkylation response protein AidB-like acyl-CoA dehydrogenase
MLESRPAPTTARAVRSWQDHRLPPPGRGRTWERFEALATLGGLDLTAARLLEPHFDALAILRELAPSSSAAASGQLWAVWASEAPSALLQATAVSSDDWSVTGDKAWCSGATIATHALVTADSIDGSRLFALDLSQDGVHPQPSQWSTSALAGADTRAVCFEEVAATPIGAPGQYVERPGFWYGAVGVAAVWYGGAAAIGERVLEAARRRDGGEIGRAYLGGIDSALFGARSALRCAARDIDAGLATEVSDAAVLARRTRAVVEAAAEEIIGLAGRALGPGPLANDEEHSGRVADLQLYLRQSHADRDLADLGSRLIELPDAQR